MKGILLALAMIGMVMVLCLGTATEMKACTTAFGVQGVGFQNVAFRSTVFANNLAFNRSVILNRQILRNRQVLNRGLIVNRSGVLLRAANVLSLARPRVVVVGGRNVGFIRGVSPLGFGGVRGVRGVRGVGCGGLLIR